MSNYITVFKGYIVLQNVLTIIIEDRVNIIFVNCVVYAFMRGRERQTERDGGGGEGRERERAFGNFKVNVN